MMVNSDEYLIRTIVNPEDDTTLTLIFVKLRQGLARDCSQGERPQSLNPCLELTLKLVATHHHPNV